MRFLSLTLLLSATAFAQVSERVLQQAPLALAAGEAREWTLPPLPVADGQRVVVEFEARMEAPRFGGSMFFLDLRLNGQAVGATVDRLRGRLLNKPATVPREPTPLAWHRTGSGWRIVYAPDFEGAKATEYGEQAYRFVIDVTDLVNDRADNVLRVAHEAGKAPGALVVRNLAVRVEEGEAVAASEAPPVVTGVEGWQADLADDGGVAIVAGGRRFPLTTWISRPGGGWHQIGAGPAPPQTPQVWNYALEFVYRSADFMVQRRRTLDAHRVIVEDTITNTSQRDLGWHLHYRLGLDGLSPATVYLGGDDDPTAATIYQPTNPTAFVPLGELGLGLVYEDDVLRAQGVLSYADDPPQVGVGSERFALAAGASYTTRVVVYPMVGESAGYFDLINALRADWGVGQTVQGPIAWGFHPEQILALSDEDLKAGIERQGIRQFVSGGGWVDRTKAGEPPLQIGFGVGVMAPAFDDFRERMEQAAAKLHRIAPDVEVLFYNHSFFNEPEPDPEAFRDSWITLPSGDRFINGWRGAYTASGGVYPTLDNRFGPAWREAIATQMDELGADGCYWDDSSHPTGLSDPLTYNTWDGHTAILDPETFEIKQKAGHLHLLSGPYKLAMYRWMAERGAPLLANGQPVTLAENQQRFPRFVESHGVLRRVVESHLYTPLAYGRPDWSMDEIRERLMLGSLPYRVGLADRSEILRWFYPITLTDLHAGWVRGEERIITAVSGAFGWPGAPAPVRIRAYDSDGQALPVEERPAAEQFAVTVPEGGVSIIERAD